MPEQKESSFAETDQEKDVVLDDNVRTKRETTTRAPWGTGADAPPTRSSGRSDVPTRDNETAADQGVFSTTRTRELAPSTNLTETTPEQSLKLSSRSEDDAERAFTAAVVDQKHLDTRSSDQLPFEERTNNSKTRGRRSLRRLAQTEHNAGDQVETASDRGLEPETAARHDTLVASSENLETQVSTEKDMPSERVSDSMLPPAAAEERRPNQTGLPSAVAESGAHTALSQTANEPEDALSASLVPSSSVSGMDTVPRVKNPTNQVMGRKRNFVSDPVDDDDSGERPRKTQRSRAPEATPHLVSGELMSGAATTPTLTSVSGDDNADVFPSPSGLPTSLTNRRVEETVTSPAHIPEASASDSRSHDENMQSHGRDASLERRLETNTVDTMDHQPTPSGPEEEPASLVGERPPTDDESSDDRSSAQDDTDGSDLSEDEEEEEERDSRRRRGAAQFLELEAEVDEGDEEEEEEDIRDLVVDEEEESADEEELAAEERAALARREQRRRAEAALLQRAQTAEELERFVQERYGEGADEEESDLLTRAYLDGAADDKDVESERHVLPVPVAMARGKLPTEIEQQSLLPTVHDPRLFMVKCRTGKEKEMAVCLLQKCVDRANQGQPLAISAVVAPDHLRGCIYIEALREGDVREAIKGQHNLYQSKVTLVPLKEMVQVLSTRRLKERDKVIPGQWVRLRRGLYAGDLAQVYELREDEVMVRLVPRLDLHALAQKPRYGGGDDDDTSDNEGTPSVSTPSRAVSEGGARSKPRRGRSTRLEGARPPRKLFDRDEVARLLHVNVYARRDSRTGEWFDEFENDQFRYGLLYKRVSRRNIIHGSAMTPPTIEELEPFQEAEQRAQTAAAASDHDSEHSLHANSVDPGTDAPDETSKPTDSTERATSAALVAATRAVAETTAQANRYRFVKGDRVRVRRGDLRNLIGIVDNVLADGKVLVQPKSSESTPLSLPDGNLQRVQVLATDLEKYFAIGDHVRVSSGKHAGLTGLVVATAEDDEQATVTVLADVTSQVLRVSAYLVTESSGEQSAGVAASLIAGGLYHVFDLVVLHAEPRGACLILQSLGQEQSDSNATSASGAVLSARGAAARAQAAIERVVVMNELGQVKTVSVQEIRGRRDHGTRTGQIQTLDAEQQAVGVGDHVRIVGTRHEHRNREAVVLHVFGNRLFLRIRELLENAGVVVASGTQVQRVSSSVAGRMPQYGVLSTGDANGWRPSPAGTGRNGMQRGAFGRGGIGSGNLSQSYTGAMSSGAIQPGGSSGLDRRVRGQRGDLLLHRWVTVTRGPHKGLSGRVLDASDASVRLELESSMKTITVSREAVRLKSSTGGAAAGPADAMVGGLYGPGLGPTTMAAGPGVLSGMMMPTTTLGMSTARTPQQGWYPSQSAGLMRTPANLGSYAGAPATPFASAVPMTPVHPSVPMTPAHEFGGGTTAGSLRTGATSGDVWRPMTPAHVPETPLPLRPSTPLHPSMQTGNEVHPTPVDQVSGSSAAPMPEAVEGKHIASAPAADDPGPRSSHAQVAKITGASQSPAPATSVVPPYWKDTVMRDKRGDGRLVVVCDLPSQQDEAWTVTPYEDEASPGTNETSEVRLSSSSLRETRLRTELEPVTPEAGDALVVYQGDLEGVFGTCIHVDEDGDCMFKEEGTQELRVVGVNQAVRRHVHEPIART
ncbi:hypothetical protein CCYA_CCYA17G4289 [Cyanidiococcus yangmingshanensis]|nr:hypothetical protein CCYA_CCYA17G4289 [Cyanidiococcus yangmingshanensis]